jgi:hypothetical protein
MNQIDTIDERAIELIAARVANALKEELAEIARGFGTRNGEESALTVNDVATRFCVSRSTVYAHWREWGGYRLGEGATAPIRFEGSRLPASHDTNQPTPPLPPKRPRRARRRRDLISDAPRLEQSTEVLE